MNTNKKDEKSMPKIAGQKKEMSRIEAHEEEKLLEAPMDTDPAEDIEKDLPAADVAENESPVAKMPDSEMHDEETVTSDITIEEEEYAEPISTHSKWTNTILAILCVCGAFLAGYLLYFNFHGHTDQPDIMAKYSTVDQQPAMRAGK